MANTKHCERSFCDEVGIFIPKVSHLQQHSNSTQKLYLQKMSAQSIYSEIITCHKNRELVQCHKTATKMSNLKNNNNIVVIVHINKIIIIIINFRKNRNSTSV